MSFGEFLKGNSEGKGYSIAKVEQRYTETIPEINYGKDTSRMYKLRGEMYGA